MNVLLVKFFFEANVIFSLKLQGFNVGNFSPEYTYFLNFLLGN